eukprot:2734596-Rhodomonas_salina.1
MSNTGYDIEDAVVLNRSAIDRGFGRTIVLKKSMTSLKKYSNSAEDRIVLPQPSSNERHAQKSAALDRDGICGVGCRSVLRAALRARVLLRVCASVCCCSGLCAVCALFVGSAGFLGSVSVG